MTMAAPVGSIVSLYVDLRAAVGAGDIIETRSGRRYRVLSVRVQQRGRHAGRQHLQVVVGDEQMPPAAAVYAGPDGELRAGMIHRIRWYRRERGAGVKERGRR